MEYLFDENCYTSTPFTMELEYQDRCDMIADKGDNDNSIPSKVVSVADNWSKEISWVVRDTTLGM